MKFICHVTSLTAWSEGYVTLLLDMQSVLQSATVITKLDVTHEIRVYSLFQSNEDNLSIKNDDSFEVISLNNANSFSTAK